MKLRVRSQDGQGKSSGGKTRYISRYGQIKSLPGAALLGERLDYTVSQIFGGTTIGL